jgi:hypothetical protein
MLNIRCEDIKETIKVLCGTHSVKYEKKHEKNEKNQIYNSLTNKSPSTGFSAGLCDTCLHFAS